jgi:hypothetical protein
MVGKEIKLENTDARTDIPNNNKNGCSLKTRFG